MFRSRPGFQSHIGVPKVIKSTRLKFLKLIPGIIASLSALLATYGSAATPEAPLLLGGVNPIGGANAMRIESALDGRTLPGILSGLQFPADPITSETVEVYSDSDLDSAIRRGGRVIRIYGPGNGGQASYRQFNLTVSDVDIVMDNDATIRGNIGGLQWWTPLQRIRWTGGNIEFTGSADTNGFRIADARDFLFDNVRIYKSTGGAAVHVLQPQGDRHERFAIINSTIEHSVVSTTNAYSTFGYSVIGSDQIWVNNLLVGVGPPVRHINMGSRLALVGNYYDYIGSSGAVRIHRETDKLWFAHNYIPRRAGGAPLLKFEVSDDITSLPGTFMNDVLVEHNKMFESNSYGPFQFGDQGEPANRDQCTNWVIRHNRVSDPAAAAGSEQSFAGRGISIANPYSQTDDLIVGPGHPDYETDPGRDGFGAQR